MMGVFIIPDEPLEIMLNKVIDD